LVFKDGGPHAGPEALPVEFPFRPRRHGFPVQEAWDDQWSVASHVAHVESDPPHRFVVNGKEKALFFFGGEDEVRPNVL
jgi:hypothetical protein